MRLKSRLLPVTVILLAALQLTSPHRAWMILLIGLGGAWVAGALWARSLKKGLRIEREIRSPWSRVGDEMLERLSLSNSSWAPGISVEVKDHSSLPGQRRSRVVSAAGHDVNAWHQSVVCHRRGVFEIGPTTLVTTDPFGVYEVEIHDPSRTSVTVLPPTVHLPEFGIAPAGRLSDGKNRHSGLGRSVSTSSVRTYLPGDSLRWVHWPTSAHHGELYIRLFDPISSGDWWVFLDLDQAVHVGEGQHSTEEHGVVLAGSLAARGLASGRSVGLVTQGEDDSLVWLAAGSGARQRWKILRYLASARRGTHTLADLLRAAQSHLHAPASLLLITPSQPSEWSVELRPLLARNTSATAFILDRASYDGSLPPSSYDRDFLEPEVPVHLIRRGWMQDLLPSAEPQVDWRRMRLEDRPWKRVSR